MSQRDLQASENGGQNPSAPNASGRGLTSGFGRRMLGSSLIIVSLAATWLIGSALVQSRLPTPSVSGIEARVIAASLDSVELPVDVQLSTTPRVTLSRGTVGFAAPEGLSSPEGLKKIAAGEASVVFTDGKITIGGTEQASGITSPAIAAKEALSAVLSAVVARNLKQLAIARTKVVLEIGGDHREVLHNLSADVQIARDRNLSANGSFRYRGEQLTFTAVTGALTEQSETAVTLKVSGDLVSLDIAGVMSLNGGVRLNAPNATLKSAHVGRFRRWLGRTATDNRAIETFEAKGPLTIDERSASFDAASFIIDGNPAKGTLALVFATPSSGKTSSVLQGTLAFEDLNLTPSLKRSGRATNFAVALFEDFRLPTLRRPRALFANLDADLRISAQKVRIGQSTFGRCAASITARGQKLYADVAEIQLANGGMGNGRLEINQAKATQTYAMSANLRDVALENLSEFFPSPGLVTGQGTLSVNLEGQGDSQDAMLSTATGTIDLQLTDGGTIALDLDSLMRPSDRSRRPLSDVQKSVTRVDTLTARFAAKDGIFKTEAVKATAGARQLTADGKVNATDRNLDVVVSVSVPTAGTDASGNEARNHTGYRLSGSWSDPVITPAGEAGKAGLSPTREGAEIPSSRGSETMGTDGPG